MFRLLTSIVLAKPGKRTVRPKSCYDLGSDDVLFETRLLTIHTLIANAAVVASAVNFVAAGGSAKTLGLCKPYIQAPDKELDELIKQAILSTPRNVQSRLAALSRNFTIAAVSTARLMEMMRPKGTIVLPKSSLHACAQEWRSLAALAIDAINALEPEARRRLSGRYSENALILTRHLRPISIGQWPNVTAQEMIEPILLPQKRRVPRFELREKCRISWGNNTVDAETINVSAGGLGLKSTYAFPLREQVRVLLESGRRFSGTISFVTNDRVGIHFGSDLSPNDPLLGSH